MKICTKCKILKPLDDFGPRKRAKDGKKGHCRECHNKENRELYRKNPKKVIARTQKYKMENPQKMVIIRNNNYMKNKKKVKEQSDAWRKKNPEKVKISDNKVKLKRKYGLTLEKYNEMLSTQNGVCKICKDPPKRNSLAVDHNHNTKQVRGLLCDLCNRALGLFKDSPSVLKRAIEYLQQNDDTHKPPLDK